MFIGALLLGLLLLVVGADYVVRGGSQLALAARVPALVVGLTIVAAGTSMPELLVSLTAAVAGSADIALANVTGSNIANILVVLGATAAIKPIIVDRSLLRREVPALLLLQGLLLVLALDGGYGRLDGVVLLAVGLVYNVLLVREALKGRAAHNPDSTEVVTPPWKNVLLLAFGVGVLVVGARLFVDGATELARFFGWSERFIGLTVVAVGTSAPEIATSVMGAWRGEDDIAVGNALGSNLFNVAFVLGLTVLFQPIGIADAGSYSDLGVCLALTLALIPVVRAGAIGRLLGSLFLLAYAFLLGAAFLGT